MSQHSTAAATRSSELPAQVHAVHDRSPLLEPSNHVQGTNQGQLLAGSGLLRRGATEVLGDDRVEESSAGVGRRTWSGSCQRPCDHGPSSMDSEAQQSRPQDGVGFGAHASLTYEEIAMSQKDYCAWVVKTAKEGGCNYRLSRLARWLEHVEKEGITMDNEIPSKGYTKPVLPKPKAAAGSLMGATPGAHSPKGSAQSATSSEAMKMMEETQKMMQQMMGAMAHIKEEVDQLKEEKPHKKKHNTSDGSFSQVDAEL